MMKNLDKPIVFFKRSDEPSGRSYSAQLLLMIDCELELTPKVRHNCVYCIDGLYIGSSEDLRPRALGHLSLALKRRHTNKQLQAHIISKIEQGQKVSFQILSLNKADEYEIIKEYRLRGVPLFNSVLNPGIKKQKLWSKLLLQNQ